MIAADSPLSAEGAQLLRNARRIVVKVGSSLVTNEGRGLDEAAIGHWCRQLAALAGQGREVIMVSSGAIAEGMKRLGWATRPHELHELQAAAAVGQMGLAQMYETKLRENGLGSAQVLLTHADLADRERYLNARSTLLTLLGLGVLPVINENDTVVNDEIKFGDNDTLGALVANLVEADVLVILTDQKGLYTADPRKDPAATFVREARAGDPALEAMAAAMMFQRVPPAWEAAGYPSLKPLGGWVTDLVARLGALDTWLRGGPPPAFWISGFFFPQGFMTGALQMYARKTKIPIDTLDFKTHVTAMKEGADVAAQPKDGVYVFGLFIVCARWDHGAQVLNEMEPGRLLYKMPVVWLEPVQSKDVKLDDGKTYACPFYKTSRRAGVLSTTGHSTNFVMVMGLPSDKPQDHWVRRGTAVLSEDEAGITSK